MNQSLPPISNPQNLNQMIDTSNLQRRIKSGASSFYWIAGMSVINTLAFLFGGKITFVVGLGITQLVDGFFYGAALYAPAYTILFQGIGFLIDLVFVGLFVFFGIFAGKEKKWAFISGMVIYALDAILMLVFKDFLGFGFHLFFLWLLFGGMRALNQMNKNFPRSITSQSFPK